jgi:hypothetical protein
MFPHRSIHKYTWYTLTSPDGQTHNQIDHVLINRRRHSSILDIRYFRQTENDTETCKNLEKLAVSKRPVNKMDIDRFNVKKLNEGKLRNSIRLQSKTDFWLWRT